jgi:hypothetical protein
MFLLTKNQYKTNTIGKNIIKSMELKNIYRPLIIPARGLDKDKKC